MQPSKWFEFGKFDDELGDLWVDLDKVQKFRVVRGGNGETQSIRLYFGPKEWDEFTGKNARRIAEKLNDHTATEVQKPPKRKPRARRPTPRLK